MQFRVALSRLDNCGHQNYLFEAAHHEFAGVVQRYSGCATVVGEG